MGNLAMALQQGDIHVVMTESPARVLLEQRGRAFVTSG